MAVESNTQVEEIRKVQNSNGETDRAANESQQQRMVEALGNQPTLEAFWHETASTDPEPLESREVPEGVTVLVTYDEANAGNVYVGNETAQPAVLTGVEAVFETTVEDTSAIYVRTPTAGDRVGVLFEADGGSDA